MNKSLAMAIAKATFDCCVRAQEKNRALQNINLDAVVSQVLVNNKANSSTAVKHWGCYGLDSTQMTHQFDLADNRESSGQIDAWIGSNEGHLDDYLGVMMEVGTDPINDLTHSPTVHVQFEGDNLACSIFKRGERLLLRPEVGVTVVREGTFLYLVPGAV